VTSYRIILHHGPSHPHSIGDVTHTKQDSIVNYNISLDHWVGDYPQ